MSRFFLGISILVLEKDYSVYLMIKILKVYIGSNSRMSLQYYSDYADRRFETKGIRRFGHT